MTPIDPSALERISDLEEIYADEPGDALTAFMLANEYLKAGRTADAIRVFQAAVAADPDYSAAWAGLAQALEADQQHDAARSTWHEAAATAARKADKQVARLAEAALSRLS